MSTKLSAIPPIMGVPDGKGSSDPAVRQAWLDQRRGGITATEVRDWGMSARRRAIITEKVTGDQGDASDQLVNNGKGLTLGFYAEHGNRREPVISEWIKTKFGIEPCDNVFSHGENPRHLASPDGVTLHPLTGELVVGPGSVLAEIKTTTKSLHPGVVDDDRRLVSIDTTSKFAQANYYSQMQWQMYVMNAERCLFVWEQHTGEIDPETGTFAPAGPPEYVWIERDQGLIDQLVIVADAALKEIDAARVAASAGDLPPVSALPAEHAALVADLLAARDAEAVAKAKKERVWKALQALYIGEGKPDFTVKIPGFANVTVSTTKKITKKVNEEKMRARAPQLISKYEALRERYTENVPVESQGLTITAAKS